MNIPQLTITREDALSFILRGMQAKRAEIEANLRDLRSQLRMQSPQAIADAAQIAEHERDNGRAPRRKFSAATRKRMATAQRVRWAKVKRSRA